MSLPNMKYRDGIRTVQQTVFHGLDASEGAPDGSLIRSKNISGDAFPYLIVRPPRMRYWKIPQDPENYERVLDMISWEKLAIATEHSLYYDGKKVMDLQHYGRVSMAGIGTKIIIMPEGTYYDIEDGTHGSLSGRWDATSVRFADGTLDEKDASANTITMSDIRIRTTLRPGDTVQISGCTVHPENNKWATIREISGDSLIFDEATWKIDGTGYTEAGYIKVERTAPALDGICQHDNRIWGFKGKYIYSCALGDPFNWNQFAGISTDSWQLETGTEGDLTACCSYGGTPVFFKEHNITRIYGNQPREYTTSELTASGVKKGSMRSLAVAGGTLFYLSNIGIMAYRGGQPTFIGEAMGPVRYDTAYAGSDGYKYYVCLQNDEMFGRQFVFDTVRNLWSIEEYGAFYGYAYNQGNLYRTTENGDVDIIGNIRNAPEEAEQEDESDIVWSATLGPFQDGSPGQKGVVKLLARLEVDYGSTAKAEIKMDNGNWKPAGTEMNSSRKDYELAIIPERCSMYWIRFSGTGHCKIYGITRLIYYGSEHP